MKQLAQLNQRIKEYLSDNESTLTLVKQGKYIPFSKNELKLHILAARKSFMDAGIKQRDLVLFQISSSAKRTFVSNFFALVSMGATPAFLTASHNKDQVTRLKRVAEKNPDAKIVADEESAQFIRFFWKDVDESRIIIAKEVFEQYPQGMESEITYADIKDDDSVLILYSSGSTSDPKGIVMKNFGFIKMLRSLEIRLNLSTRDNWLMWLPLEHVFGILAGVVIPMYCKSKVVHMDTGDFIQNPKSWFDVVNDNRINKTAAPNFAYPMILKTISGNEQWDLSCIDFILNGGEPLSRTLVERFESTMSKFGVKKNVIMPVYGLTEALGAVTINHDAQYPEVNLEKLKSGIDFDLTAIKRGDMDLICQGKAIPGMQMGIFDENNNPLDELVAGEIHIKSEALFSGYLGQDSSGLFVDGWFDTGDLGFIYMDMLYVIGRKKDMFFIHGKNIYLRDIEQVIAKQYSFRIAACGENNSQTGENAIYLFVETDDPASVPVEELKKLVFSEMGFALTKVIPIKQFVRTPVGKIVKQKTLDAYKEGKI